MSRNDWGFLRQKSKPPSDHDIYQQLSSRIGSKDITEINQAILQIKGFIEDYTNMHKTIKQETSRLLTQNPYKPGLNSKAFSAADLLHPRRKLLGEIRPLLSEQDTFNEKFIEDLKTLMKLFKAKRRLLKEKANNKQLVIRKSEDQFRSILKKELRNGEIRLKNTRKEKHSQQMPQKQLWQYRNRLFRNSENSSLNLQNKVESLGLPSDSEDILRQNITRDCKKYFRFRSTASPHRQQSTDEQLQHIGQIPNAKSIVPNINDKKLSKEDMRKHILSFIENRALLEEYLKRYLQIRKSVQNDPEASQRTNQSYLSLKEEICHHFLGEVLLQNHFSRKQRTLFDDTLPLKQKPINESRAQVKTEKNPYSTNPNFAFFLKNKSILKTEVLDSLQQIVDLMIRRLQQAYLYLGQSQVPKLKQLDDLLTSPDKKQESPKHSKFRGETFRTKCPRNERPTVVAPQSQRLEALKSRDLNIASVDLFYSRKTASYKTRKAARLKFMSSVNSSQEINKSQQRDYLQRVCKQKNSKSQPMDFRKWVQKGLQPVE